MTVGLPAFCSKCGMPINAERPAIWRHEIQQALCYPCAGYQLVDAPENIAIKPGEKMWAIPRLTPQCKCGTPKTSECPLHGRRESA